MKITQKAIKILNKKYGITKVDYAIVVGSGLKDCAPELENKVTINYSVLGLPKSKVQGHSGSFTFGTYNGKSVALVSRMHYYESGDIKKVRMPLEIMAGLGCEYAVLLTSCGGINKSYQVGDVMMILDHINFSGINPLIGIEKIDFVNMSDDYNSALKDAVRKICKKEKLSIKEGVHIQTNGPSYETRAEINAFGIMGADAVSMSTAHDCIIANYYNMKVLGFAAIVNVFDGCADATLSHEEVLENAKKANVKIKTILTNLIK